MTHNLNRKYFFNILQKINKSCNYNDFYNQFIENVPKFKELIEMIDLDSYNFNYIQNRFIEIRKNNVELNQIKQIIFCPFDTSFKHIDFKECNNRIFEYQEKKRNSYLTKPISNKERKENILKTNEVDCIEGNLDPSILNAIIIYMLNHFLLNDSTMVVFTLKNHNNNWQSIDVLDYLQQNNLDKTYNKLTNIIDLDFCSQPKGMPKKDLTGRVEMGIRKYTSTEDYILKKVKAFESSKELEYEFKVNRNEKFLFENNFNIHRELVNYFNIPVIFKTKLFIFTDKKPTNKFSTFFLEKPFLVEYDVIEKFLNLIINLINI